MRREAKTNKFAVEHCNGEWEIMRLPRAFDVTDVAARYLQSDVWAWVPCGTRVMTKQPENSEYFWAGPCWAHWDGQDFDKHQTVSPAA